MLIRDSLMMLILFLCVGGDDGFICEADDQGGFVLNLRGCV